MQSWVTGNLAWSFATRRYFGADHLNIKKTLVITLSPGKTWEATQ